MTIYTKRRLFAAALGLMAGEASMAQTNTSGGAVVGILSEWNQDGFIVSTTAPFTNPAKCPGSDGYTINSNLPGYKTVYSAVLTAFSANSNIAFTIENTGCISGRPIIKGVFIAH